MRIFLDTNVIMDYLSSRGNVEAANKIVESIEEGENTGYISAGSYYTITYLTDRLLKEEGYNNPQRLKILRHTLSTLLSFFEIANCSRTEFLLGTLDQQFNDLEDSYQLQAANAASCEYLITNNIKDFQKSDITNVRIITPTEFAAS
ncbi:MAG: PIN domain-containing protein [Bacteroidaceae bacterium]|nr:PIN domain-containing protein [Bacteroidaceae bacterium]